MEYVQLSMDEYIQSKNDIKNNLGGIGKEFCPDRMAARRGSTGQVLSKNATHAAA